ncbi:MAG: hypothetical protein AAF666_16400 [Pseudomonadota bacterium]
MNRVVSLALAALLTLSACGSPPPEKPADPGLPALGGTDALLAGKTLTCNTGGPSSKLTFGPDGTLSGQLLQTQISGTWYAVNQREVHAHVQAGAVSLRDNLRLVGQRWVGKTTSCRNG